ncbi:hypothetical protein GF406_27430 [candidate division KSB1 bacterium]|nr:hypothetical protein [candidate division KSB1 bacterium]
MAKIPNRPEDIFDEFKSDFLSLYGDQLESIILYGSGARGDYIRKKSDINFMLVLTLEGIQNLSAAFPLVKKWRKSNVATPLFVTTEYIESSLDSFPIEFLNMKSAYKVVYGKDALGHLNIDRNHLRLQVEAQIKGKLLHLREQFLGTLGKKQALKNLLKATVPAFTSIFAALLTLKDIEVTGQGVQVLPKTAQVFELDEVVFKNLLALREGSLDPSETELVKLAEKLIHEIRKCALLVDKL